MAQIVRQLYAAAAVGRVAEPVSVRDDAWTRRRACEGKVKHRSQWGALLAATHWERTGDDGLHAYRCPFNPDHWHTGHAPLAAATRSTSA